MSEDSETKHLSKHNSFNVYPYTKIKNSPVIGTFNDSAFQITFNQNNNNNNNKTNKHNSNNDEEKKNIINNSIPIELFSPYGYLRVPLIGCYGEEYEPIQTLVTCILQSDTIINLMNSTHKTLYNQMFNDIQSTIKKLSNNSSIVTYDNYLFIHSAPNYSPCQHFQCSSDSELNIILHSFALNNAESDITSSIYCGFYNAMNVESCHISISSLLDRGLPYKTLDERTISIHSMRFSPCNNQIQVIDKQQISAFYLVSCYQDRGEHKFKTSISFHVVLSANIESSVESAVYKSKSVGELLINLLSIQSENTNWKFVMNEIMQLIQMQSNKNKEGQSIGKNINEMGNSV